MNRFQWQVRAAVLLIGLSGKAAQTVSAASPCQPTQLSEEEAGDLVLSIDHVVEATNAGIHVGYLAYYGRASGRFFYFQANGDCEAADGCLIGYWAVDKITARVVDEVLFNDESGTALSAAQATLRAKHCIGNSLIKAAADLVP